MIKLFKHHEQKKTLANSIKMQKTDAKRLNKACFDSLDRKHNFILYIRDQSSKANDLDTMGFYKQCELGKWFNKYGDERYGHLEIFQSFKETHTNAHLCAAEIVSLHCEGDKQLALEILSGPYFEMVRLFQKKSVELHKELAFSKVIL